MEEKRKKRKYSVQCRGGELRDGKQAIGGDAAEEGGGRSGGGGR